MPAVHGFEQHTGDASQLSEPAMRIGHRGVVTAAPTFSGRSPQAMRLTNSGNFGVKNLMRQKYRCEPGSHAGTEGRRRR